MAKAKQKPETDESPRVKGKPASTPKKAAEKTVKKTVQKAEMKARETVKEQTKPTSDTDESPERYAENRMEQSAEYAVDRTKEQLKPSHHRSTRDSHEQKQEDPTDTPQQKERPESVEPKERPEQPQRSSDTPTVREERNSEPPQRSPQAEQYQRTESAKKITKEKQHNVEQPRSHELEERVPVREKPISEERNPSRDTEKPLDADCFQNIESAESPLKERTNHIEEPSNPKIKEYQIKKWQEQSVERKLDRTIESEPITEKPNRGREPETADRFSAASPDPKEKFDHSSGQEESVRADVKDYQVKKYRESTKPDSEQATPDTRTVREKTVDVKELDRSVPSDHVRDRLSDIEPKEKAPEANPTASQQRQYAMEKYRNALKNRKARHSEEQYEPKSADTVAPMESGPAQSGAATNQRYYSEHRPMRSNGSELRSSYEVKSPKVQGSHSLKEPTKAVSKAEKTGKTAVKSADKTIKTAEKTVKTTERSAKTAAKTTEKTAQATAKTAQKAAQATAKTAQATAKTIQAAAKAAAQAAKAAGKAIASAIKAIVAAVKALIAAIAAGGWVAVLIIVIIALICVILALCFGLFASNEATSPTQTGKPMTEAIQDVNNEFVDKINAKISRFKKKYKPDEVILIYEGDTDSKGTVMNWADVLGIYAVGTTTDPEQPTDVLIVTPDKVNILRDYFMQMNSVSYDTEVEKEEIPAIDDDGEPIFDDEGEQVMKTNTTLTITITISSMDYRDAASHYNFNESQMEMLTEIMQPEYYPLFAELTGDVIGDGGEYGFGLDINPDLPPNELGYQIVQAAKRYIGRSYASMDCSCLARTAYKDCGLTSMNGLSSVRMAQKCQEMGCLFTDPSQLQAGDLIFFARFDPSRGKDYCGDVNRCGTGKCRRWLHIHHVAIYINDEYLIDSTGGDNSVQIRKHWGMNTSKWKWVCFGRPTT